MDLFIGAMLGAGVMFGYVLVVVFPAITDLESRLRMAEADRSEAEARLHVAEARLLAVSAALISDQEG